MDDVPEAIKLYFQERLEPFKERLRVVEELLAERYYASPRRLGKNDYSNRMVRVSPLTRRNDMDINGMMITVWMPRWMTCSPT